MPRRARRRRPTNRFAWSNSLRGRRRGPAPPWKSSDTRPILPLILSTGPPIGYYGGRTSAQAAGLGPRQPPDDRKTREGTSHAYEEPPGRPARTPRLAPGFHRPPHDGPRRPARRRPAGEPPGEGDQPVSAPARAQPRGLVPLGSRGVRQGQGREQADLPLGRLQ